MAVVKAEYLVAKDSESGEEQNVKFVPPAPSDGDLGGISKEDSEQITKNKNDIANIRMTLWDKILDKLTSAVVERLNTTNKTVIGALNELNSKLEITAIAPNPLDKGNVTSSYKISPKIIDQSILCVCRSEVYLITLGQKSATIFNSIFLNKVFDAVSIEDASAKLAENKKDIIFTCTYYENPIFIGRF